MKRKPHIKNPSFWFAIWAAIIVSYVVIRNPMGAQWASSVVSLCTAVIVLYVGGNKAVDYKHGPEMIEEQPKNFGNQ